MKNDRLQLNNHNVLVSANIFVAYNGIEQINHFRLNSGRTILDVIKDRISEDLWHTADFPVDEETFGPNFTCNISKEEGGYKIKFSGGTQQHIPQELSCYKENEVQQLLQGREFGIEISEENDQYIISTEYEDWDNKKHRVGGKGKYDLFRMHIANFKNIAQHLANNEDNNKFLVAMATGSGKTMTQGR